MELQGTIKKVFDTQTFASGFQKREFVLLTLEQFPQPISIELLSDKVDIIDSFKEGDLVNVGINIRGREWLNPQGETKYFNSIVAWKITHAENNESPTSPRKTPTVTPQQAFDDNPFAGDDDLDLPF